MRFLIVRTEIRAVADTDIAAAWAVGGRLRDETTAPEPRRQVVHAEDRDAALLLARALASVGAVRAGRHRVKVLPIEEPDPAFDHSGSARLTAHPDPEQSHPYRWYRS